MLFIYLALDPVLHKRYPQPAVMIGGSVRDAQTVFEIPNVLFMYISARIGFFLAVLHPRKLGLKINVKVNDEIRLRKFQLYIFKVVEPFEKLTQFLVFELGSLMHRI